MAKKPAKVMATRVGELEGRAVVVLTGKDGAGRPVEMCIPVEGWDAVHADGQNKIIAAKNQEHAFIPGQWIPSIQKEAGQMRAETTDDGKVVLMVRLGLPDELRLSMAPSTAHELSDALRASADQCSPRTAAH